MSLPEFDAYASNKEDSSMSPAAASVALGVSRGSLTKIIEAGVLPTPLPTEAVMQLAARPSLRAITGELTVLRTAAPAAAYDDVPARKYIGFHTEFSDQEAEDASLRWWRIDPDRALDNRLFAVTVGQFPVGVYELTGIADQVRGDAASDSRYHFTGELLARMTSRNHLDSARQRFFEVIDSYVAHEWVITAQNRTHPLMGRAMKIMRSRVIASSGGPIGYLSAP